MKKNLYLTPLLLVMAFLLMSFQPAQKKNIVFFGSSVCHGGGTTGYAWQFFHTSGVDTTKFAYKNVSIGGDNTLKWEHFDRIGKNLIPAQPDIVILGLSLGNEGLGSATDEDSAMKILEQFRSRLLYVADSLRSLGLKPVIANCYANSGFTPLHYGYTQMMNRIINTWNYPSINLLGAVDNGEGKWAEGYENDPGHPNPAGYKEMSYAISPTMFDAIIAGKGVPSYDWSKNYTKVTNSKASQNLICKVQHTMHSFATTFRFRNCSDGELLLIESANETYKVEIKNGRLIYGGISAAISTDPNRWNIVTISHNYAAHKTLVGVNGKIAGEVDQKILPTTFVYGGTMKQLDIKDVMLHRSSLNVGEIGDLSNNCFIRSSLELYVPMTNAVLANMAQSGLQLIAEPHCKTILMTIPLM